MSEKDANVGILNYIVYGIIQTPTPLDPEYVDGAFRTAIDHPNSPLSRDDFLEGIRHALESDVDLGKALPTRHDDATIRAYLRLVEARLAKELGRSR